MGRQRTEIDKEGPFGLQWGASTEGTTGAGVLLKDTSGSDFGKSYSATGLPKVVADQEGALLSFGYDDKLWRIVGVSRKFESDPTGASLKSRYQELVDILAEKYGKPRATQALGDSIYSQPQYFLAGIESGRSNWFANFDAPNILVQIGLIASTSSEGRWRIIFENKELQRAFGASKRSHEKGSL